MVMARRNVGAQAESFAQSFDQRRELFEGEREVDIVVIEQKGRGDGPAGANHRDTGNGGQQGTIRREWDSKRACGGGYRRW